MVIIIILPLRVGKFLNYCEHMLKEYELLVTSALFLLKYAVHLNLCIFYEYYALVVDHNVCIPYCCNKIASQQTLS